MATTDTNKVSEWANKRFLLIDDFPSMRQMLRGMLRGLGVRYVEQVDSGLEAIAALSNSKYDVVLCDYNMGNGKNGQQVLEEAKINDLIGPACIWLMVSAEKSVESVMGAAEYQPDGYLIKPITEGILHARLNRIWAKKQVFKEIDESYHAKDYLRAARLCDAKLGSDKLHELELMRMKATLLLKSGEPEQARAVFEQVMTDREFAWAKAGLAKIRTQNGELEEAKQMLQEVVAENPHYLEAYDQLATVQQQLGEFAEAEQVLLNAVKLSPNSVLRQKNLGTVAFKLGNLAVAEKAFRKSVEVGTHSVLKTPDSYLGLARLCGQKNEPFEALKLLAAVQNEFNTPDVRLRSKIAEGMVYHESGDYVKARKSGDELGRLLASTTERPNAESCLEMARLMFAVGVKDAPVALLGELIKNNHDNDLLATDIQQIFDKARMSESGAELISTARKESVEVMDRGVILWKGGHLDEAIEWMRTARKNLPTNIRILLNFTHVLIASMQTNGYDPELAAEANEVLMVVDQLSPNLRRFAQLMEQLSALSAEEDTE